MHNAEPVSLSKNGAPIRSVDDWYRLAPPKQKRVHWQEGRSAMECARAWCVRGTTALPEELSALIRAHRDLASVVLTHGEPEAIIKFDAYRGERRNADIALEGRDPSGRVAVTVEAKADEPFGETVGEALAAALERLIKNPRSNGLRRIEALAGAFFRPAAQGSTRVPALPGVGSLRYQLLTATAGTLAFAHQLGAGRAVMIVHKFVTERTRRENIERNEADLNFFVQRLTAGAVRELPAGRLVGPFAVHATDAWPSRPRLYIGKAVRRLGASAS